VDAVRRWRLLPIALLLLAACDCTQSGSHDLVRYDDQGAVVERLPVYRWALDGGCIRYTTSCTPGPAEEWLAWCGSVGVERR